jgi:hypothetical protein
MAILLYSKIDCVEYYRSSVVDTVSNSPLLNQQNHESDIQIQGGF